MRLQALEAVELSEDPDAVAGIVVWRGPFGAELGRAGVGELYADEPSAPGSLGWAATTWLGFILTPVGLIAMAVRTSI